MSRIFISYRRADSAGYTGRLYDRLSAHFGPQQIFMDIDAIKPGEDFVQVIENSVGSSSALVAVIGREWLDATDNAGQRRLDNPHDFVRLEIAAALKREIRVIPALVDGAPMPSSERLPDDLAGLARRNALEISNARFDYDVSKLIETLESVGIVPLAYRPSAPARLALWVAVLLIGIAWAIALAVVGGVGASIIMPGSVYIFLLTQGLVVGAIGGIGTALVLRAYRTGFGMKPMAAVVVGWLIGCAIFGGIPNGFFVDFPLGVLAAALCGAVGGIGTGLALRWSTPVLTWKQAVTVALGWCIASVLGLVLAVITTAGVWQSEFLQNTFFAPSVDSSGLYFPDVLASGGSLSMGAILALVGGTITLRVWDQTQRK